MSAFVRWTGPVTLNNRVGLFPPYLGVALIYRVRDGLHKVVPHAALGVGVSQVRVSVIAGLVATGRLDQAQQGAAHQDQQQARGGARGGWGSHDGNHPDALDPPGTSSRSRCLCCSLCFPSSSLSHSSLRLSPQVVFQGLTEWGGVFVSLWLLIVQRRVER